MLPVAKFHDYFTSSLPAPQKGPSVAIGITGDARVQWAFTAQELQDYGIMTSNGAQHLVPTSGNTLGLTMKRGNAVNINIFFVAIVNAATGKEYAQEERKNGRRIKRSTLLKSNRLRNKAM